MRALSDNWRGHKQPCVKCERFHEGYGGIQTRGFRVEYVVELSRNNHGTDSQDRMYPCQRDSPSLGLSGLGRSFVAEVQAHQHVVPGDFDLVEMNKHFQRRKRYLL